MSRHPVLTSLVIVATLAAGACNGRGSKQQADAQSTAEQQRLASQLDLLGRENQQLRSERDQLATENQDLRSDNLALKAQAVRQDSARDESWAGRGGNQPAAAGGGSGDWVVVCASVGPNSAAAQRNNFTAEAARLNRVYGGAHGELFGVRDPRSGGLQVVYGANDGGYGLPKAKAEAFLAALKRDGKIRDAFLLNVR